MVFVETSLFSRLLGGYLSDEECGKGEKEDLSAAELKRVVKLLEELTNG